MGDTEVKSKKKSFRRLMNRFAEKTSMQGVGYINSAKVRFAKAIWIFLLLAAIGAMTFHLYHLFYQFLSYPKVTKVSLKFNNLQMPAITICNVNPIKRSKLKMMTQELRELVDSVNPNKFDVQPKNDSGQNKRVKRFVEEYEKLNLTKYNAQTTYDENDGQNRSKLHKIKHTFQSIYLNNQRIDRVSAGHSLDEMMLSCSFDGILCYPTNFSLYQTPRYGNCFTMDPRHMITKRPGPAHGLVLILNLETYDYLRGLTEGSGARITVHDRDTLPIPDNEGLHIPGSFETEIGLRLVNITRLPDPYGECTYGTDFQNLYDRAYSRQACLKTCEQERLLLKCGCFNKDESEIFALSKRTTVRACRSSTEYECLRSVTREFESKNVDCQCLNPCKEKSYEVTSSNREWPTEDYSTVLMQRICQEQNQSDTCKVLVGMDKSKLSSNFLKLVIYYQTLNYEQVTEEPEIGPAQFASDVGGALGLWIGLSVLSIFEIFQLVAEICDYGCSKCRTTKKINVST